MASGGCLVAPCRVWWYPVLGGRLVATAGRACVVHACMMRWPPGCPQLTRGHLTSRSIAGCEMVVVSVSACYYDVWPVTRCFSLLMLSSVV